METSSDDLGAISLLIRSSPRALPVSRDSCGRELPGSIARYLQRLVLMPGCPLPYCKAGGNAAPTIPPAIACEVLITQYSLQESHCGPIAWKKCSLA